MVVLPFLKTPLQKAVERLVRGAELAEVMEDLTQYEITTRRDAEAVVTALRHIPRVPKRPTTGYRPSPLFTLIAFFQETEEPRAAEVLRGRGIEELVRIFDASFPPEDGDEDDVGFLLKILVLCRAPGACERVVRAALHPATCEHSLWSVIFSQMTDGHPCGDDVIARLTETLPAGFAAVGFLDLVNQRALAGSKAAHPFDSADGLQRLESYLTEPSSDYFSYAHSAAAALPFLRTPSRQHLLDLAAQHPEPRVRFESFWASAKLGDPRGIASLAEASRDPRRGTTALSLLEELGRLDAAPEETRTEEHVALAEMAEWLSYPTEFGAYPDALRVYDTRELDWPPTNDRRRLWLIEYTYAPSDDHPEGGVGVGMVGSITFSLFGETTAGMAPEDLYGLHCAWELEARGDPRAPEERTAEVGREILGI